MPRSEIEFVTFLMIEKVIRRQNNWREFTNTKELGRPFNTRKKQEGAVTGGDYLFYLTNHDQTHTSLWGWGFE